MTIWNQAEDTRDALANGVARCDKCIYFRADGDEFSSYGTCRRHAPIVYATGSGPDTYAQTEWPTMSADAWCGEWDSGEYPLDVRPEAEGSADTEER